MDPRTAAHTLAQIAAFLELRGEKGFKARAYERAARAVAALDTDDLGALDREGTLASTPGLGPATLSVIRDLVSTGESRYLEQLRDGVPEGLLELLEIPYLAPGKIHYLNRELGIDSVDALDVAARDGRLLKLKGFGPKSVEKIVRGIERHRVTGHHRLLFRALDDAESLLASVRGHPDVVRAELAGSVRRHCETVGDVDVVAACSRDPLDVARSFANGPGVRSVRDSDGPEPRITYADDTRLDLHCVSPVDFAVAWWRATGSDDHVRTIAGFLEANGVTLDGNVLRDAKGRAIDVRDEAQIYEMCGLPFIPAEMRELGHEIVLAELGALPRLLEVKDLTGALHCHSDYSDGKASITQMAAAAHARGWSYIGITDHSKAAFYAGGMTTLQVQAQHAEIDAINAAGGPVRVLKGIEADILADGTLDYDSVTLDTFDFVVGSVHSRFAMDRTAMTDRVLRAMEDPHLTILGHPTGRLLLNRDPYALDMDAVLTRAAETGVAIELNADPHRLDLDWRLIPRALELGVTIAIGPDAHSTASLDYVITGVQMARKAGVEARDVLNTRTADEVLAFARARRNAGAR